MLSRLSNGPNKLVSVASRSIYIKQKWIAAQSFLGFKCMTPFVQEFYDTSRLIAKHQRFIHLLITIPVAWTGQHTPHQPPKQQRTKTNRSIKSTLTTSVDQAVSLFMPLEIRVLTTVLALSQCWWHNGAELWRRMICQVSLVMQTSMRGVFTTEASPHNEFAVLAVFFLNTENPLQILFNNLSLLV